MWEWSEAVKYASARINECGSQELDTYEKLLLGVKHDESTWVYSALRSLYFHGSRISKPENKAEYNNIIPVEQRQTINWTLQEGSQLIEKTLYELIQHAPRMPAADDMDWSVYKCDDHAKCVNALSTEWRHIRNNVPGLISSNDGKCGLTYDLMDYIEKYKFKGMDPRCRSHLMRDLNYRLIDFNDRICRAVSDRLLGREEKSLD
ncbi:hypothetical protein K435DRAFT_811470 [Dendrothele bispora CBS 962.96]|uniref:Uncharacterized protein n=1 Tax=Dendrothele bispora (strain CBS 962.96) TaxID=1314807 RepID=A0A4S8KRX2_DENBC|nr:hypothetical protein K435DRAFT_811470 [Dendrothele bispora CBS 962.96]